MAVACFLLALAASLGAWVKLVDNSKDYFKPERILVDTDVDADDVFALFYLLKQNPTKFNLQAITINTNGWSEAGHAVNYVYDILFMMGRDDIPVGVGGEGAILRNGTVLANVGGYQPLIDQESSTIGGCRYRQAIPVGPRGRLDVNTNYGLRKAFLPQGSRRYTPLVQPTSQQVMIDAISSGPITVILMGAHTNFAIFLMSNPQLKRNIRHIYAMGGAFRSHCPNNHYSPPTPSHCTNIGNLFPQDANPYAEFNMFLDPFAVYTVLHSGIPLTLIPLDATNTIPVSESFFLEFERRQDTFEAKYCSQTLKLIRDTWLSSNFYEEYFMWDSFMAGVALSIMSNSMNPDGENEFAEMEYMNITVVTSNEPYGTSDGSNPLVDGRFNVLNGVHSGHIQTGMKDPFCLGRKEKCQDGYTIEATGKEVVRVLVATAAKSNDEVGSSLQKAFYKSFLDTMNQPEQTGRFNINTQFPHYKEIVYKPDLGNNSRGQPIIFDMDMSAGDFLALLYLLKLPVDFIDLKGILISPTGWATPATIDVVYDLMHMMGRDDIPVGLGDVFAVGEANPTFPLLGDCKYVKAIPHGSGGFLDSDTLYGLARDLPRSPRRYTAENSKFGAPRNTEHPELRQPLALDVWKSVMESLDPGSKITILTNGPLTNLAQIISSGNSSLLIKEVYIVGGHIANADNGKGNLFTVPSNEYGEFNFFLDPLAAEAVFNSSLHITLIPLHTRRTVSSFSLILNSISSINATPEAAFCRILISRLWQLERQHHRYHHMDMFLGEILGAVILSGNPNLKQKMELRPLKVMGGGDISKIGQVVVEEKQGNMVKVLEKVDLAEYYDDFAKVLTDHRQSAVIGSFQEQKRMWSSPSNKQNY